MAKHNSLQLCGGARAPRRGIHARCAIACGVHGAAVKQSWSALDIVHGANRDCALAGSDRWDLLASEPFVDVQRSPALTRALHIPFWSKRRNIIAQYQLYDCQRTAGS